MAQDQFLLYDHQKTIRLQPERVLFYLQGEIIEAFSENNEVYYLLFNKYRFLTAVKATRIKRQSYIEHAFKKGMVFEAPHPFINKLLSTHHTLQILSFKQLLKKLELHHPPQEQAYILTFFESFFPKKQLFNEIMTHYYEYRRNGQLSLGYRIIRILMDFAPKHSLVKSLVNDIHFNKYADLYNEKSEKVLAADLIFAEKVLYAGIEDEQCLQQLLARYEKASRWMDIIALSISKRKITPSADEYDCIKHLLEQNLNEDEMVFILEQLSLQFPAFLSLQQDLFNLYIKAENIEKVFNLMNDHHFKLGHSQLQSFGSMLEQFNADNYSLHPEVLHTVLKSVINVLPEKAVMLLNNSVISMLKTHDLPFINEWLKPFKSEYGSLQIFGKIEMMTRLNDSLDEMQTLGELYCEFRQYDKAIECFSWEMELNPSDPKPLQWLSKTYYEMGEEKESEVYQQLCINVQKWA